MIKISVILAKRLQTFNSLMFVPKFNVKQMNFTILTFYLKWLPISNIYKWIMKTLNKHKLVEKYVRSLSIYSKAVGHY